MLKNSYVKIGCQYIAIQVKGLPQGAPPSPPLARLVCIRREWQWNKDLTSEIKLYSGMRFMDDVCIFFFYHTEKPETKIKAENVCKNFKTNCYFKQWNLKQVDTNIFLSTEYQWISGNLDFKWANKNRESIKNLKIQKIIRFVHSKSFTSNSIKNNSLYAQILRVTRTTNNTNILSDLKDLCNEYELLGYKRSIIELQKGKAMEKWNVQNTNFF
jgi:hypothetical protein